MKLRVLACFPTPCLKEFYLIRLIVDGFSFKCFVNTVKNKIYKIRSVKFKQMFGNFFNEDTDYWIKPTVKA